MDPKSAPHGGPAFPTKYRRDPHAMPAEGMALRDYFAAAVIGHITASPLRTDCTVKGDVLYAYEVADAMLAERAK